MALKIENPAMSFISSAAQEDTVPAPIRDSKNSVTVPKKKTEKKVARYNLVLSISNKMKFERFIEREGYKSANDYINYLISCTVANEPEPTEAEIQAYIKATEARKKTK